MPSYGWPPYKGGVAQVGGARFWQLQICTIRGQSPRCCGPGCVRESALEADWHGFPKSSGVMPRAAPRQGVPASHGASWRRTGGGGSGGSDPGFFAAGAAPGRGRWCTPKFTTSPPLFGGRSLHSDPWREGYRVGQQAETATSTTGGALCAPDPDSGSNNPNAVRVETGAAMQQGTGDIQQPVEHRTQTTQMTVQSHVLAWMRRKQS